jgi:hypothetical protein
VLLVRLVYVASCCCEIAVNNNRLIDYQKYNGIPHISWLFQSYNYISHALKYIYVRTVISEPCIISEMYNLGDFQCSYHSAIY